MNRLVFVVTLLSAATAVAQTSEQSPPAPTPPSGAPAPAEAPPPDPMAAPATGPTTDPSVAPTLPPDDGKPKEPQRGDFNAGGQARFPSGPDEAGAYASFNWVAFDLKARYYLLKQVTLNATVPLAIIKPDTVGPMGPEPSLFGGLTLMLDARVQVPKMSAVKYDTTVGLQLTFGYMKERAMLLSEKDFPLFLGDMKPGFAGGLLTKLKLSSLLDFSLVPAWVYQSGSTESATAVQIPMALGVALGSLLKVNLELGIFTGDDYSFGGDDGGRIATGASLDLKLGHILLHAGAGVASLLTGAAYPTISDSFYVDLNVKYAK